MIGDTQHKRKKLIRIYIIKRLKKIVSVELKHIKHSKFLEHYKSYMEKMDRSREGVEYRSLQLKRLTSHQKPWNKGDDDH